MDSVVVEREAERAVHAWRASQQLSLLCRSLNFTVTLTLWEATPSHILLLAEVLCPILAPASQKVKEPFAEGGVQLGGELVGDNHVERWPLTTGSILIQESLFCSCDSI